MTDDNPAMHSGMTGMARASLDANLETCEPSTGMVGYGGPSIPSSDQARRAPEPKSFNSTHTNWTSSAANC